MKNLCPRCSSNVEPDGLCPVCFLAEGLAPPELECPSCHAVIDSDARFCSRCGSAIFSAGTPPEDPVRSALEEKLGSSYRIVRLLGRGGMGSVYLARELTLDRDVAIKVMSSSGDTRQLYERFRREARTAAKLSHPNIVPLHAFGEVEGMPYFVMGYVRGESLAERLRREGRLPEGEARRLFREIADALDHAHQQGVIHRDVKPDNILLEDHSGRALLTDFGVAKPFGQGETLTQLGSVVGTPEFMSPEQAAGRGDIDGRSDIYSLGVVAWAMVTGELPFAGDTPADVLRKHLVEEPPALRSVAPHVSDGMAQAIERCLAKEPDGRWPDARSLHGALAIDQEIHLPDALRPAESSGVIALAITWTMSLFYSALMRANSPPETGVVPWDVIFLQIGVPLIGLMTYVFFVLRLRRQGVAIRESQTVIWREPAWWLWWYPRNLRREGNVWERLPVSVRALRWSIAAFVTNLFVGWTIFAYTGDDYIVVRNAGQLEYTTIALIQFGIVVVNIAAWVIFTIVARRNLRDKGLFEEDVNRVMMSVPPSRAGFWARPQIAAILAPAPEGARGGKLPDSPHAQMQMILRETNELTGDLRTLGAQASVAARHLVAAIESIDLTVADLKRNLDEGEQERLRRKIASLSTSSSDRSAPFRALLEKQLELHETFAAQIDEAKEKRARHLDMLRSIAWHVAALSTHRNDPSEVRSISAQLRNLCNQIQRGTTEIAPTVIQPDTSAPTIERP